MTEGKILVRILIEARRKITSKGVRLKPVHKNRQIDQQRDYGTRPGPPADLDKSVRASLSGVDNFYGLPGPHPVSLTYQRVRCMV